MKIARINLALCIRAALCMALLLPVPARAETVIVRSGEHPGFSRLVMDFDTLPGWSLTGTGKTRRLVIYNDAVALNPDGIFDRIGRSRIASVDASRGTLGLSLNCACTVSVFTMTGARLVVDVRDPARKPMRQETVADAGDGVEIGFAEPQVLNATLSNADDTGPTLVSPDFDTSTPVLTLPDHMTRAKSSNPPAPSALPDVDVLSNSAFSNLESGPASTRLPWDFTQRSEISTATEALVDALDRAGRQGLVDRIVTEADEPPRLPVRRAPGAPLPLPIGDRSQLRVSTSLDNDLTRLAETIGDPSIKSGCLDSYDFDVGDWGNEEDLFAPIGALRASLVGEFDIADIDAARNLARAYIYLSFGAEARAVVDGFAFEPAERAVMAFLAEVADGKTRAPEDEAATLVGCPSPVAMWALLSVQDLPKSADVAKSEIAAAFSDLPLHLRRQFGPVLVQRFLAMEDVSSARVIWNAVNRADGSHGEEFILASAELSVANGDIEGAERAYASLESASPGTAPIAVARLIRSRLDNGRTVDAGLIESAATLSFENRGTPVSRDLKIEELRGRISLGQWARVFDELPRAEFAGALTREDADRLLADLYFAMADRASPATFLPRAFEAAGRMPTRVVMDEPRRAVAKRLVALGFAEEALRLMADISGAAENDLLVIAEAELVADRPARALETIAGRQDVEATLLRARAKASLGRLAEAADAFEAADAPVEAALLKQRAGDWSALDTEVGKAASTLAEQSQLSAETPLAKNRELAEAAEAVRADVARLREALAGLR